MFAYSVSRTSKMINSMRHAANSAMAHFCLCITHIANGG